MTKTILRRRGRITIPKEIRRKAMIHSGTQIDFHLETDGTISMIPITKDIDELKGIVVSSRKRPVSLEEMKNQYNCEVFSSRSS